MGEAKRKNEFLKNFVLTEMDNWSFPPTDWERQVAAEIDSLPRVMGTFSDRARWMRMVQGGCHANCHWYTTHPDNKHWSHCLGWLPAEDIFVVHSVIRCEDDIICITPQPGAEMMGVTRFPFIADPRLSYDPETGIVSRDGHRVGIGVRRDPDAAMEKIAREKAELEQTPHVRDFLKKRMTRTA